MTNVTATQYKTTCNNKGFTLLEVIIVVALLATLLAVSAASLSQLMASESSKAITSTAAMYDLCRVSTLSGEIEPYMTITLESDGYYGTIFTGADEQTHREQLGDTSVLMSYTTDAGDVEITASTTLTLKFDRNGALVEPSAIKSITATAGEQNVRMDITAATGYYSTTR